MPLESTRTYSSMNAEEDGPLGYGWTDSYNMSISIDGETGAATVREVGGYSGNQIHTITDPMGRTTTFAYDVSGNLVEPATRWDGPGASPMTTAIAC